MGDVSYQRNKGKKCATRGCTAGAYTKGLCKCHWQAQYMPAYRLATKDRERARRRDNKDRYTRSPKAVAARLSYMKTYAKTPVYKKAQAAYRARNREKILKQRRGSNYKSKYGITVEDYERMLRSQRGRCKICRRKASEFKRRLHVDHCHITGKVRGLLCAGCNLAVGHLEKDPVRAAAILAYLADHTSDIPLNHGG